MKKFLSIILAVLTLASLLTLYSCSSDEIAIGAQNGTTGYFYMKGDADWGFDGFDNIETKGYDNGALAVQALKNGNVQYVVIDKDVAVALVAKTEGTKMIDIALTTEDYGIAVDKAQPELRDQINTILAENKEEIAAIVEKYSKFYSESDSTDSWTGTTIPAGTVDPEKADKQLVLATNAAFPPFEFKVGENFAGIDMEIAKLIADKLGMELVIKDMKFDAVVDSVGKNNIDIAVAGLTISDERLKVVDFSDNYHHAAQVVICKEDDKTFDECKTAEDVVEILKGFNK